MTLTETILARFAAERIALAEVPILQPADPFLDMAGEDLRRRIFLTQSETGESLCLRPEFTIPVCRDHIARQAGTPRRYAYLGEVFRQHRAGGTQFLQAGIEDLGETDTSTADARSVADACRLLNEALPDAGLTVIIGDQAIFEAVLAALGLPRGWQMRLARAFGSADMLEAALTDLASPPKKRNLGQPISRLVAARDRAAVAGYLEKQMEVAGISPSAGRTPDDIARRLIEKAELGAVRIADDAFEALKRFLAIREPLAQAGETLRRFADDCDLFLDAALEQFEQRADALAAQQLQGASFTYDAAFGRPLDYYTGLVFEISAPSDPRPLVGGGRYDRLLTMLGAEHPIPGVGFSVWLDRIEGARKP
ncbi:ATP phosphoribosyltransferase regulatory subunit [Tianweitania populi]|uniref:ATP phosphoribosyltransferase regulatory subunit n=1 Tax=Tianweitania populi TaxID=1607949 RepID=A0A8J3DQ83_9HYPH|nr:ATP phosphoribosyltransferase regulatory subunit [Tianweitania populi]GHD14130.1 ATP phosphoribosyltransferase regulatory subunit [Tianweitania populi]